MKVKKLIKYCIFFVIALILIIWSNYKNKINCTKYAQELTFKGIVKNKYVDHKQHDYPIVQIISNDTILQEINLILDHSGFFDYIQDNDSIVKATNDLKVHIYRQIYDTTFTLDIHCN